MRLRLFERFPIRGLANITGGGIVENLPRVMPAGIEAVVRRGSWPVPPIFELIARLGRISRAEMDRTFNNGLGMVAIVPPGQADAVVAHLRRRARRPILSARCKAGAASEEVLSSSAARMASSGAKTRWQSGRRSNWEC